MQPQNFSCGGFFESHHIILCARMISPETPRCFHQSCCCISILLLVNTLVSDLFSPQPFCLPASLPLVISFFSVTHLCLYQPLSHLPLKDGSRFQDQEHIMLLKISFASFKISFASQEPRSILVSSVAHQISPPCIFNLSLFISLLENIFSPAAVSLSKTTLDSSPK